MKGNWLLAQLCSRLDVAESLTRPDGLASVHRTSCTGLCDQGPAGLVNGRPLVMLTPRRIDEIADLILNQTPLEAWPADFFAVHNPVWRHELTLSHPIEPGLGILSALALGADAVLVGRPLLWGLTNAGAAGAAHVLRLLRDELEAAMALTGCRTLADITPEVLVR